ncbi:MAG TPA: hypothetical protein DCY61_05155 [Dehalococcoidia bacterium]|nr:hypothetical protein [Dehalococcoidia bacterium]
MVGLEQLAFAYDTGGSDQGERRNILEAQVKNHRIGLLAKKYGASSVFEFDTMVKEGRFHEEDAFEDYFKFDNLEAERDLILWNIWSDSSGFCRKNWRGSLRSSSPIW